MTMPPDVPLPAPGDTSWSDWASEQEDASDLVRSGGYITGDGTILNTVKLTQAAYDALGTKVATTLYVIVG